MGHGTKPIEIDSNTQSQINRLFAYDKKVVIMPSPMEGGLKLKKGNNGSIALSIRNTGNIPRTFRYVISHFETELDCDITPEEAISLIILGKNIDGIILESNSSMETPVLVKFYIPKTFTDCAIRYKIEILDNEEEYKTVLFDLTII